MYAKNILLNVNKMSSYLNLFLIFEDYGIMTYDFFPKLAINKT